MARNHYATDEPGVHVRLAGRIFDVTLAARTYFTAGAGVPSFHTTGLASPHRPSRS